VKGKEYEKKRKENYKAIKNHLKSYWKENLRSKRK
jgi:hypothetical protein